MESAATEIDPTTNLPFDDVRTKNIRHDVDHPLIDSDEESLRALGRVTGEGREPNPFEWSGSALPESGPSESAHAQARRAANMMGNKRREDFSDELQARAGIDADTAAAVTSHIADGPAPAVRVVRDDGTQIPPLHDHQPITEENSFKNLQEARRAVSNFRDAQAAEAQQLLWELGAAQEQRALAEQQPASSSPEPQQPVQAEPPRPQPQRPDPVAVHQAAAAQAYQTAAAISQMSSQEAMLWTDIQRHEAQVYKSFPEASSFEAFEEARKNNPARIEALLQEKQRSDAAKQQLQALTTNRQAAQEQVASRQREQQFRANDDAFNKWLSKAHPNYSKGARRNELTAAVKSYLRDDLGMTDQDIDYHYRQSGLLRSAQAQAMVANGAMWKLSQQAVKRIAEKRVHAPPVQRPGVFRPHGADAEDSVRSLQRELEGATGERALRLSVKLQKARRAAGI